MPIEIKIPAVGESITEVQIGEWLRNEGDTVSKDEPLAVIDSEKTTFELPAPESGTLAKILHKAGETVGVGSVIAQFEPGSATATAAKEAKPVEAGTTNQETSATMHTAEAEEGAAGKSAAEMPSASVTAKEEPSPDMGAKRETDEPAERLGPEETRPHAREHAGTDGEVKTEPAHAAVAKTIPKTEPKPSVGKPAAPPPPRAAPAQPLAAQDEEIVPMTMLRRTIARRLVEAQQMMAVLTTFNEVDMGEVQALRHEHQEAFQERYGIKLGLMSFFVKAVIDALKQYPQLNAEVRGKDIVYRNHFDIGVALATGHGLVVPVLRRAERLSFAEIEKAIAGFAQRSKEGELKPEDLEGGTFTITNGGVFGSLLSTPIINPPQSGILGLHAIADRPVACDGNVVICPMMYVALTYDHRIVDGREAVLFVRRVKEGIENPARMLIEI